MTIKQTSVNINQEKWLILKNRGYKLQDILDSAFDSLLNIDGDDQTELAQKKENLEKKLETLRKQKEIAINNYDKQINEITLQIKEIDYAINKAKREAKESEKKKEEIMKQKRSKNIMFNIWRKNCDISEIQDKLDEYCDKYKCEPEEVMQELREMLYEL